MSVEPLRSPQQQKLLPPLRQIDVALQRALRGAAEAVKGSPSLGRVQLPRRRQEGDPAIHWNLLL